MGVVALTTAAALLGMVRSPQAKNVNGIALLNNATRASHTKWLRGGSLRPAERSTIQSSTAPMPQRIRATQTGGKLSPAMRIRRKETPQTAERRMSWNRCAVFISLRLQRIGWGVHPGIARNLCPNCVSKAQTMR